MRRGRFLLLSGLLSVACAGPGGGSESPKGFSGVAALSDSDEALVRARAVRGDAKAQYDLASRYFYGRDIARDDAQAVQWFRRAAEQGHADAQMFLAMMYRDGRGVTVDFAQAAAWARKSAEQGQPRGQSLLGIMSFDGKGVPKDAVEGYKWERLAAARTTEEDMKRFVSNALDTMAKAMTKEEIAEAEGRAREWVEARQIVEDMVREMALKSFCGETGEGPFFIKVEGGPPSPALLERLRGDPRYRSIAMLKAENKNPFGEPARGAVIAIGPLEWPSDAKALVLLSRSGHAGSGSGGQVLVERDSEGRWSAHLVPGSGLKWPGF